MKFSNSKNKYRRGDADIFIIIFITVLITVGITGMVVGFLEDSNWQELAIQHGAAHYDSQTGDFTWNNPAPK
jgi:hypothetical protein